MSQSQHIVIVDDEAPAREMVGDYLKMHGFTVTLCDGGKSLRGAIETRARGPGGSSAADRGRTGAPGLMAPSPSAR